MEVKTSKNLMKWYIIRAQSNRERSVAEKIKKEGEKGDLMDKIGKVLVPMEKNFTIKDGKKIVREKVMYPGYIFIETSSIGELAYFVKGCDGATALLSDKNGTPQVLKNSEVDKMIGTQQETEMKKEMENRFLVGEEVVVSDGPFSGFSGRIEKIIDQKIKIAVLIFGRETIIDLLSDQIDKK